MQSSHGAVMPFCLPLTARASAGHSHHTAPSFDTTAPAIRRQIPESIPVTSVPYKIFLVLFAWCIVYKFHSWGY
jgi:hypothetical protein